MPEVSSSSLRCERLAATAFEADTAQYAIDDRNPRSRSGIRG
jgi:hypothetical protein